jgi:membrane protease YdiL (CAAX protease family)
MLKNYTALFQIFAICRKFLRVLLISSIFGIQGLSDSGEGLERLSDSYLLPKEYRTQSEPDRPRWVLLPSLASFVLPGFDQWTEGQDSYGMAYTGAGLAGIAYARHHSVKLREETKGQSKGEDRDGFGQPSERQRRALWGAQIYQLAGSLSSYHAYRTAIWTHKPLGKYSFICRQESMQEIVSAPFRFDFLTRSTTLWPLGIGLALALLSQSAIDLEPTIERDPLTTSDAFFTGAISYGAGVGEEAVFRGFLMPELRQALGSDFWSNALTAVGFAAAHLGSVDRPIAQLALGYYWGDLTQRNNWEISESIFIHTWWDVIAFLTVFQIKDKEPAAADERPALHLPPFEIHF